MVVEFDDERIDCDRNDDDGWNPVDRIILGLEFINVDWLEVGRGGGGGGGGIAVVVDELLLCNWLEFCCCDVDDDDDWCIVEELFDGFCP